MKSSVFTVWILALAVGLWTAAATGSLVAWFALAIIGLLPALMMVMLGQRPVKTTAEILREVETGRPL
jgi:hypothetical protein